VTDTFEQIVRELADYAPAEFCTGANGEVSMCIFCDAQSVTSVAVDHKPDCLWLRAKQAVEENSDAV
jgi:hypothetical protein